MNAQHWLRENIKVDMMVLQKVSIDACAVSTNWKLLTSGMSMSLEAWECEKVKIFWDFNM